MSRQNYFNTLTMAQKLDQLGRCRFMDRSEFNGVEKLRGKKVVIVGCGAQGLNQGLNMRDSGLDISYALRADAIEQKRVSYTNATSNGFKVGTYEQLIPTADLVCNLAPDKQHADVVQKVMPLMKKGATLAYSHGFNIVEEGQQIRKDLTVVMVAPKCPGTEVREEYKRGFGVPTLIAVHRENDPNGDGLDIAKAYAAATGGDRAGVLESSFVAEVKSDLMGEQTILCGMLQTGSILCFDRMVAQGIDRGYASKLVQFGWETITEALKQGGLTLMLDRLSNPAKIKAFELADELRGLMRPLFKKHQDDIITGVFSTTMMKDWDAGDVNLLGWRAATADTAFEQTPAGAQKIGEQEYFDHAVLMVAMVKAGVELAFECMVEVGMKPESAYYESLHETPLIANLISRKKLYEMNKVISDTAEYGCYLFSHAAVPLLKEFVAKQSTEVIGKAFAPGTQQVDNRRLLAVNQAIESHPVEKVGATLRGYMTAMKQIPPSVAEHEASKDLSDFTPGPGLTLVAGPNGSGKSTAARALGARVAGSWLLSAESQQAFYEAQLAADEGNFKQGVDTSSTVHQLLGQPGRAHPLFASFRLEALWERGYRQLSTGEARKVLLLQAVLRAPTLLILDDPFEGLDRAACAELAQAIVHVAEGLPVLVVGTFDARNLPFSPEALKEVAVIAERKVIFRGAPHAFLARASDRPPLHTPPPVALGSWYPPLDPSVPLAQLVGGRVCYGEEVVFDGLDFSVRAGQHTLIEGPNGSGKSTLLEMITGDHPQAYSNDLHLFGRRRGSGETVWDIKKNIGLVSARLHRDYRVGGSVEEVLLSGLFDSIGVYQQPTPSDRARALAWLAWLELGIAPSAAFRELSFGQQRLVLIARAAIKVPPLVVLDEPTSGLDPDNRIRALDLVESLCTQQKSTVLMVTHRADERAFWQEHIGGAILSLPPRV